LMTCAAIGLLLCVSYELSRAAETEVQTANSVALKLREPRA